MLMQRKNYQYQMCIKIKHEKPSANYGRKKNDICYFTSFA